MALQPGYHKRERKRVRLMLVACITEYYLEQHSEQQRKRNQLERRRAGWFRLVSRAFPRQMIEDTYTSPPSDIYCSLFGIRPQLVA